MQARPRKALRPALLTTAGVAAALLIILLVAPLLVDLPAVRAQLHQKLSQAVNGQIAWDSLQLQWLPSPRGVLHGVRVELPGRLKVTIERVDAGLRLTPLALGRAEISSITIVRPVVELDIAASAAGPPSDGGGFLATYRDAIGAAAQGIRKFAPASTLATEAARVIVRMPDLPPVDLDNLSLRAHSTERGIELDATSASSLWRELRFAGRVDFADLSSQVKLEALEVRAQPWLARFDAGHAFGVEVATADLNAQAQTDGRTSVECDLDLAAPSIRVSRNQRSLDVSGVRVAGKVVARAQGTRIDVTEFQLGRLVPAATGTLGIGGDGRHPDVSIDASRLDLTALRDAAVSMAGDVAVVAEYAPRIRGGQIPALKVAATADTWTELFDPPNLHAAFSIERAAMLVPFIEEEAGDVSGRAEFADSVFRFTGVGAQFGESRLRGGSASYALRDRSIDIDSQFDVESAQGLSFMRKILSRTHHDQLDFIASASGRLRGRARLVKTAHADWKTAVEIAPSDAAIQFKALSRPVMLRAARLTASPRLIAVSGLRAALGSSTVEDAAAQIALDAQPTLTAATGQATFVLDELFPSLHSLPQLADALRDFTAITGTAHVTLARLTGPLKHPREWQYDLTAQPRQLRLAHKQLPDPILVTGGSVRIDPATMTVERVAVALLDAQATVSGSVGDYRAGPVRIDGVVADGTVGPNATQWGWDRAGALPRLRPATPLRFTVARARWDPDRNLDLQGAVQFSGGQDAAVDLAWSPHTLDVRRLAVKDALSNATVGLAASNRVLQMQFAGNLDGRTVAALFEQHGEQAGALEGDLQIMLDLDAPKRTTARGHLSGRSIDLSRLLAWPLRIDRFVVETDERAMHIREAAVQWAQLTATMRGEITQSDHGPVVTGQIALPGIVLDELLEKERPASGSQPASAMPTPEAGDEEGFLPRLWPLPLTGRIELRMPFLQYQDYRVAPVASTVTLAPQRAQIELDEAQVCGIAFPLTAALTPQALTIAAQLRAHEQPLAEVVRCLTRQEVQMTGRFDLRADLSTHGTRDELVRNLSGKIDAQARDGSTYKFKLLGNILSFKPVTDLFARDRAQLQKEGLAYRRLNVTGRFEAGKFHVDEGAFDSDAIGLAATGAIDLVTHEAALTVLVAPFHQVNRVVGNVPIVGYILGGDLISIAVGIHGDIRDPTVTPLGPQAVTSQLTGIFERTLKVPFKLFEPKKSSQQENEPAAQP
ncbi:MAG TPA: AsmA-like C-terminal domain-containing protein [Burkholderiaceae bacterium]|nr:AsmA-like C-terminal domain-containing protein [Burkholderiaceae bacterium]